jgi:uncharacterized membrane protein YphA (DoxX/SURF4 family)
MVLQGFLLWIGASILITTTANAIFRLSWFSKQSDFVSDLKIIVVMLLSEAVSIAYVLKNHTVGIFGLWGIQIDPLEDAILSGILISGGADFVYQIWATIFSYKEKVKAEALQEKTLAEKLK